MRSRMTRAVLAGLVLGCAVVAAPAAEAAPITFFGEDFVSAIPGAPRPSSAAAQNSFLSKLTGVGIETFESFSTGQTSPLVLTFGADTATLLGSGQVAGSEQTGAFATSGSNFYFTNNGAGNFTINFSAPQAAFGFFGTDIGDIGTRLALTLSNGTVIDVPHTGGGPNGSVLYFALIGETPADVFTSIEFSAAAGAFDSFGFDDMTIGRFEQVGAGTVPEPASVLLLGTGLAGVIRHRLRARRRPSVR